MLLKAFIFHINNIDMNYNLLSILIKTGIIIVITIILVKIIGKTMSNKKFSNYIHIKFFKSAIIAIIWLLCIITIISQFNEFSNIISTILAGSGIIAVILGLAAQESFANMFSGLFISIFKPFNIGDRIKIVGDDTAGYIEDITLRHTVIRTYMNVRIIIPNSIIGNAKIENSTYSKGASYPLDINIAFGNKEKREKAIEIMEDVVINHPLFFDNRTDEQKKSEEKPVEALCNQLTGGGINLRILIWTENIQDNPRVCSECRLEILNRFEQEGIELYYNNFILVDKK